MIDIYTDGSCEGNTGPGGWAAVIIGDGLMRVVRGRSAKTTNNRMELTAAIKGLEAVPKGAEATVYSDSEYLVNSMTRNWKRNANLDLWERLDGLVASRRVRWQWVKGHAGDPVNEEANAIANEEAKLAQREANTVGRHGQEPSLTHVDASGQVRMVDVGAKPDTERVAVAKGTVVMAPQTLALIRDNQVKKGDVLAAARIAGVMAAKRTSDLIPLCHPLPLTHIAVEVALDEARSAVEITATAKTTAKTGVEMEALTAVSVAALTIYDMCKGVDRAMRIEGVRLISKSGGRSGDLVLEE